MRRMTETRQEAAPPLATAATRHAQVPISPNDPAVPVPPVPPMPPGPDLPEPPVEDPPGPEAPLPGDPGLPPAGDPPSDPPVRMKEIGGPAGPEPTRYGDWERKGRVSDF
jgi:Protein of unknown function (DUF1674)